MLATGVLAVLLVLRMSAASYPMSSKVPRYSRSLSAWTPLPYYYHPRTTRPVYYPEGDYYYPQEPYYPFLQLPSYYLDTTRPYIYGYEAVPGSVEEFPEEIPEEESLSDNGPYAQESWYPDQSADTLDDISTQFLHNLILAQLYSEGERKSPSFRSLDNPSREDDGYDGRYVYENPEKETHGRVMSKEDEDVRELKDLVEKEMELEREMELNEKKSRKGHPFIGQTSSNDWESYRAKGYKRSSRSKSFEKRTIPASSTASPQSMVNEPQRGQKEVVLPRPANPPRTPDFQKFAVRSQPRDRQPSVYQKIQQLINLEDKMDKELQDAGGRLQKRSYIPSEESLVAQLGRLKKDA